MKKKSKALQALEARADVQELIGRIGLRAFRKLFNYGWHPDWESYRGLVAGKGNLIYLDPTTLPQESNGEYKYRAPAARSRVTHILDVDGKRLAVEFLGQPPAQFNGPLASVEMAMRVTPFFFDTRRAFLVDRFLHYSAVPPKNIWREIRDEYNDVFRPLGRELRSIPGTRMAVLGKSDRKPACVLADVLWTLVFGPMELLLVLSHQWGWEWTFENKELAGQGPKPDKEGNYSLCIASSSSGLLESWSDQESLTRQLRPAMWSELRRREHYDYIDDRLAMIPRFSSMEEVREVGRGGSRGPTRPVSTG